MLHKRESVRDSLLDEVFSSSDLSVAMPKYRMPDKEHLPRHAYQVVSDELMMDGNSRQNLATFCQTWLEPEVLLLMAETLDKNMVDKDEYPQTAAIEERCVHMLADLWNSPDAADTRHVDDRVKRSGDARGDGAAVELARSPARGRPAHRRAQPHHRAGAGVLAQVRALLGCRAA